VVDEDGRLANADLGAYKMPTICDIPALTAANIPVGRGPGPFNAKGIGELPLIPVAGAIANAVADAIRAHLFRLPISPERVLEALDEKRSTTQAPIVVQ
jgi:CO/xanthine dehydrogenase Mo-binding subunit